jgi:dienelactone hydrolase
MSSSRSCVLIAALASIATSGAVAQETVRIPWKPGWIRTFYEGAATGELEAKLFRPAGTDKAPFVVFLHGCAGLDLGRQSHWAQFFTKRGVGFLMVDSLTTRKVADICTDKRPWPRWRADDAVSALAWLQAQPYVRTDRVALMGQSQGGGSALLALHEGTAGGRSFVAGLLMYPACRFGNLANVRLAKPTLILIGGDDNWTPVAECEKLRAAQSDKSRLELTVYPGAAHSFDNPVKATVVLGKFKVGEHPASRDKARERAAQWADAMLRK